MWYSQSGTQSCGTQSSLLNQDHVIGTQITRSLDTATSVSLQHGTRPGATTNHGCPHCGAVFETMAGVQKHLQYKVRCIYFERNSNACSVYPASLMNNSLSEGAAFLHTAAEGCAEEFNISTIEYDLLEQECISSNNVDDGYHSAPILLGGDEALDDLLAGQQHGPAVLNGDNLPPEPY